MNRISEYMACGTKKGGPGRQAPLCISIVQFSDLLAPVGDNAYHKSADSRT